MSREEILRNIRELTLQLEAARREELLLDFQVREVRRDIATSKAQALGHMLEAQNLPHHVGVVQEILDKSDLGCSDNDDDEDEGKHEGLHQEQSKDHGDEAIRGWERFEPPGRFTRDPGVDPGKLDNNPRAHHLQRKKGEEAETLITDSKTSGSSRAAGTAPRTFYDNVEPTITIPAYTFAACISGDNNIGTFPPISIRNGACISESNAEYPRTSGEHSTSPSIYISCRKHAFVFNANGVQVVNILGIMIAPNSRPATATESVKTELVSEVSVEASNAPATDGNIHSTSRYKIIIVCPLCINSTTVEIPDLSVQAASSSNDNTKTTLIFVNTDLYATLLYNKMDDKGESHPNIASASCNSVDGEQTRFFNGQTVLLSLSGENKDVTSSFTGGGNLTENAIHNDTSLAKNHHSQSERTGAESTCTADEEEVINPDLKNRKLKCAGKDYSSFCNTSSDSTNYSTSKKRVDKKQALRSSKEPRRDSKKIKTAIDSGKRETSSRHLVKQAKETRSQQGDTDESKLKDGPRDQNSMITDTTNNKVINEFACMKPKREHSSDEGKVRFSEFLEKDTPKLENSAEISNLENDAIDPDGDCLSTNQKLRTRKGCVKSTHTAAIALRSQTPKKTSEKVSKVPSNDQKKEKKGRKCRKNGKASRNPQTAQKVRTAGRWQCVDRAPVSESSTVEETVYISPPRRRQRRKKSANFKRRGGTESTDPNSGRRGNKTSKAKKRQDSPVTRRRDARIVHQNIRTMENLYEIDDDDWNSIDTSAGGGSSDTEDTEIYLAATSAPGGERRDQSWKSDKYVVVRTLLRSNLLLRYHPYVIEDTPQGLQINDLVGMKESFEGRFRLASRLPEDDERCLVKSMSLLEKPSDTFEDVVGYEDQIRELKEAVILPLSRPDLFQKIGIEPCKGVLLFGPTGTGKTLLARACANACGCAFLRLSGTFLLQKFLGAGASVVRNIFEMAKTMTPCIIFIDDLDAIGKIRRSDSSQGDREIQRTLLELLCQMDGFSNNSQVKILAATNRADVIDPALLRSGRLDRKIELELPNLRARELLLEKHAEKLVVSEFVSFEELARSTEEFSGAHCKIVCTEAGLQCLRRGGDVITHEDFSQGVAVVQAKRRVCPPYFA